MRLPGVGTFAFDRNRTRVNIPDRVTDVSRGIPQNSAPFAERRAKVTQAPCAFTRYDAFSGASGVKIDRRHAPGEPIPS
jgi:hypothetical protein